MSSPIVAGVRRAMKELVDGTIRVQIDIDPKYRDDFLKNFGSIDMPVALAPLVPGFEFPTGDDTGGFDDTHPAAAKIDQITTFTVSDAEAKELGGSTWTTLGPLCQSSIMLCKDERFQAWIASQGATIEVSAALAGHRLAPEEMAAAYIRQRCEVETRKQLDESDEAKKRFAEMMAAYRRWLSHAT